LSQSYKGSSRPIEMGEIYSYVTSKAKGLTEKVIEFREILMKLYENLILLNLTFI